MEKNRNYEAVSIGLPPAKKMPQMPGMGLIQVKKGEAILDLEATMRGLGECLELWSPHDIATHEKVRMNQGTGSAR
jgi:hypothetical protein